MPLLPASKFCSGPALAAESRPIQRKSKAPCPVSFLPVTNVLISLLAVHNQLLSRISAEHSAVLAISRGLVWPTISQLPILCDKLPTSTTNHR